MQHWFKKLISLCLAVAVLLAPLEFSLAHESMMQASASKEMGHPPGHGQELHPDCHHPSGHDQQQQQPGDNGEGCMGDGFCKTCVYCSPAISSTTRIQLDRPMVIPTAIVISAYSIDLPLDLRPPKSL